MRHGLAILFCSIFFIGCQKTNLTHERYIQNNTAEDTIVVRNPDFDDAIDTIAPGNRELIYSFTVLDTQQPSEPCAWLGDTLIVQKLDGDVMTRSVKIEDFWTYTITGDNDRLQTCTFVVTTDDF